MAAIMALAVVAAGGYFGYVAYQEQQRNEAVAAKQEAKSAAAAKHRQQVKACKNALGDYVEALQTIDSRLDVGLNVGDLSDLAGQASVEKDQIGNVPDVGFCGDAKRAADDAMSAYATTASDWDDCIWDDYCDPEADLDLQSDWADAHTSLGEAKDNMSGEGDGGNL